MSNCCAYDAAAFEADAAVACAKAAFKLECDADGDDTLLAELEGDPPSAVESVWLMSISCCSWFIENI